MAAHVPCALCAAGRRCQFAAAVAAAAAAAAAVQNGIVLCPRAVVQGRAAASTAQRAQIWTSPKPRFVIFVSFLLDLECSAAAGPAPGVMWQTCHRPNTTAGGKATQCAAEGPSPLPSLAALVLLWLHLSFLRLFCFFFSSPPPPSPLQGLYS